MRKFRIFFLNRKSFKDFLKKKIWDFPKNVLKINFSKIFKRDFFLNLLKKKFPKITASRENILKRKSFKNFIKRKYSKDFPIKV